MGHGTHIFGYIQTVPDDLKEVNRQIIRDFEYDCAWPFVNAFSEENDFYWGGMVGYALHLKGDLPSDAAAWLKRFHVLINQLNGVRAAFCFQPEITYPNFTRVYHKLKGPLHYRHIWEGEDIQSACMTRANDPFLGEDEDLLWQAMPAGKSGK